MLFDRYRRLAEDARTRAAAAQTDYIRRDYLKLLAFYEERSRVDADPVLQPHA